MEEDLNPFAFFEKYKFHKLQLVFCVDVTSSMRPYIEEVKDTLKIIMKAIQNLEMIKYEFAFVGYRDHPPEDNTFITKHKDFTDPLKLKDFIEKEITAKGGGDVPEAVLNGLNDCVDKLTWDDKSIKVVFHIADAPPHGTQYHSGYDAFKDGCPKGYTAESVAKKFKDNDINYILIDCGYDRKNNKNPLRSMITKFGEEKCFGCFHETKLINGKTVNSFVAEYLKEKFNEELKKIDDDLSICLLYTSPSPRD